MEEDTSATVVRKLNRKRELRAHDAHVSGRDGHYHFFELPLLLYNMRA